METENIPTSSILPVSPSLETSSLPNAGSGRQESHGEPPVRSPHSIDATDMSYRGKGGPGRKARACRECKRLKLKCETLPGDHTCRQCLRKGFSCIQTRAALVTSSSVEIYELKIDSLHLEVQQLRQSIDSLVNRYVEQPSGEREPFLTTTPHTTSSLHGPHVTPSNVVETQNTRMDMTRENSADPPLGYETLNGAVEVTEPMSSLYEVTRLRNIRSNQARTLRVGDGDNDDLNDFITRGVITLPEAEQLYTKFQSSLNHYLWVGLEHLHPSLKSVRLSSKILTATILTVTALHIPTSAQTFDNCYGEFLSLISSSMFSRFHSIDDVRGLCIAAFWLSDVSWKLSGHAIRIATELNIHHSFFKALEGDKEHFLRARLWYMLYVCDHHSSIAYGRPPMIAESVQIREHELFLASPFASTIDMRLLSQVSLMQILTRVHDQFAVGRLPQQNPHGALLSESDFIYVRNYNLEIDNWRVKWFNRQCDNKFIGSFPPKGNILYSYFAKLQLNSFAIRGVSISQGRLSTERKEFANMAISAAASILTFVMEEEDIRRSLVGTPLYVHTMIAFASVFLLKVITTWNSIVGLNVDANYAFQLIERTIVLLRSCVASDHHLVYHIATGLEKMVQKCRDPPRQLQARRPSTYQPDLSSFRDQTPMRMEAFGSETQHMENGALQFLTNNAFANLPIMNDSFIHEAFGTTNDVYDLLTSQFS